VPNQAVVTLSTIAYNADPTGTVNSAGNIEVGSGGPGNQVTPVAFFDTQVSGLAPGSGAGLLTAYSCIVPDAQANDVQLFYDNGGVWNPVGAGQTTAIQLDSPRTGEATVTFSVTYTDATTPAVSNLTGTVFTIGVPLSATTPAPTIILVTSATADGSYSVGAVVPIQVTLDHVVTVTGVPQLALNSGGTANYASGSGGSTLTFTYAVAAGENSSRLDESSANALTLNGGSIVDGNGNSAILAVPAPAAAGSLGANKNIVIDTVAPTVVDFLVLFGNQSYSLVSNTAALAGRLDLPWQVTGVEVVFSKAVYAADVNSLTGVSATGFSGLGTKTLTWTFAQLPTAGSFTLSLHGSGPDAVKDLAGNALASGANNNQSFKVLVGDFNGDGKVNASDLQLVKNALSAAYNVFADFDGSGTVDINDYNLCRANLNKHL
jgi:hypothetical protein